MENNGVKLKSCWIVLKEVENIWYYVCLCITIALYKLYHYIDWLVQDKHHSIVNALQLRLFCTNPQINSFISFVWHENYCAPSQSVELAFVCGQVIIGSDNGLLPI